MSNHDPDDPRPFDHRQFIEGDPTQILHPLARPLVEEAAIDVEMQETECDRISSLLGMFTDWIFPFNSKASGIYARLVVFRWALAPHQFNHATQKQLCDSLNISPRLFSECYSSFRKTFNIELSHGRGKATREKMRASAIERHWKERRQELEVSCPK